MDVQVGFLHHWLGHGVPGGDQGHHPVRVHVHTQLDSVALQWEGEAVAQHLHGPLHLREPKESFFICTVNGERMTGMFSTAPRVELQSLTSDVTSLVIRCV